MKKIAILFVAAILILSGETFAQKKTKKSAPDSSSFIIDDDWEEKGNILYTTYGKKEMFKELNLSVEQKSLIKDIDKQKSKAVHAIKDDSTLSKKIKNEKIKEQRLAYNEALKKILTPAQNGKLQQLKELYKKDSNKQPILKKSDDKTIKVKQEEEK